MPVHTPWISNIYFITNNGSNNPSKQQGITTTLGSQVFRSFVLKLTCLFSFQLRKLESWATCLEPLLSATLLSSLLTGCGSNNGLLQSRASHRRASLPGEVHNENQTSREIFVDGPSQSLTLNVPSQEPGKKTSFFKNPVPNSKAEATPRHNTSCMSYPLL